MVKYVKLGDPTASWQVFDQKDENGFVLSIAGSKIHKVEETNLIRQGIYFKALVEVSEKEYEAQEKALAKETKETAKDTDAKEEVKEAEKATEKETKAKAGK
jgi:hypothetical protein